MPVFRYRSVADMPDPAPVQKGSEAHWQRVARVWRRAALLSGTPRTPGVRRFRSIAELKAHTSSAGSLQP